MKKLILFLLCSVCMFASAQNQNAIIQKINKAASSMQSMQCDFVQTKHLKLLKDKMVSNGKMYYQSPNLLRWEYVNPYTYTFILNDSKVLLKKDKRNDVIDINKNKVFKEIARMMMNSVVGKCLNDTKTFSTTITSSGKGYVATLIPLRKDIKQMYNKIILHFDATNCCVRRVEMYEKSGDFTVIELKNVLLNKQLNAKLFSLN